MPESRYLGTLPTIPRTALTPITPPRATPGIFDYLREMAGRIGGPRYSPTGQDLSSEYPGIPTPPPPIPAPPSPVAPPAPSPTPPPSPMQNTSTSLNPMDFGVTKTEGGWKGVPYLPPEQMPNSTPPPSAPPISFSWGGNRPQPYTPGETSIADFAGAPAPGTDRFMGRATSPGSGTFSALGPPAVRDTESMYDDLERARLEEGLALSQRNAQDPLWQERGQAKVWREAEVGAQNELRAAADQRITETYSRARERLRQDPSYLNPTNPDGSPVPNPDAARQEMERALTQAEEDARLAILGSMKSSSTRMPSTIFR